MPNVRDRSLCSRSKRRASTSHRRILHLRRWHFIAIILSTTILPFGFAPLIAGDDSAVVDYSKLESGEEMPGGAATSRKSNANKNAFSNSPGNLNFKKELDFKIGNGIFKKLWVSAPASTQASDGLGPLYNARSCQRCHLKDGRGHTPEANWPKDDAVSMFLRLSIPPQTDEDRALLASHKVNVIPDPVYGGQLQDLSIQGHEAEGKMFITYKEENVALNGGATATLRKPSYKVTHLGYGPLHEKVMLSPRVAPQMIGLGLLDAIRDEDILAKVDPDDKDGDGISGRQNLVWSLTKNGVAVGRYGWKAGKATVADQAAGAFAGDLGLSTPLVKSSSGDCTKKQSFCMNAPNGNTEKYGNVEVSPQMFDLVVFYSENLAVPKRRDADAPEVLEGKGLFHAAGCAACHTPSYVTGELPGQPHLSGQKIWPYTDLLLHDMGEGLADNRPEGVATGSEWKTPPLWGVGLTRIVSDHNYLLHDGRARGVLEAILWHGGEAQNARDAVVAMTPEERKALIRFVESL